MQSCSCDVRDVRCGGRTYRWRRWQERERGTTWLHPSFTQSIALTAHRRARQLARMDPCVFGMNIDAVGSIIKLIRRSKSGDAREMRPGQTRPRQQHQYHYSPSSSESFDEICGLLGLPAGPNVVALTVSFCTAMSTPIDPRSGF